MLRNECSEHREHHSPQISFHIDQQHEDLPSQLKLNDQSFSASSRKAGGLEERKVLLVLLVVPTWVRVDPSHVR